MQNGKKKAVESPVPVSTPEMRAASATPPPPVLEPETQSGNKLDSMHLIPRLVDTDGQTAVPRASSRDENLDPSAWTCEEVAQFLEINEIKCDPLVEAILEQVRIFGKVIGRLQRL